MPGLKKKQKQKWKNWTNWIKNHICSFVVKNDWSIKVSVDGATQYITGTEDKNWKFIASKKSTRIYKVGVIILGEKHWIGYEKKRNERFVLS